MEQIELNVVNRDTRGSAASKKMRRDGMVPGVVYSEGEDALSLAFTEYDYSMLLKGKSASQMYSFKSDDSALNGKMVIVRDSQIEPVKGRVQHIDFLAIKKGHKVQLTVAVELVGEAPEVRQGLAVLSYMTHELEVECLPSKIPSKLELDISSLEMGSSLHAGDVPLEEGVELRTDPAVAIVSVVAKQIAAEPTESEEVAGSAEGADAGKEAGSEDS